MGEHQCEGSEVYVAPSNEECLIQTVWVAR